jgi:hypothetical protein
VCAQARTASPSARNRAARHSPFRRCRPAILKIRSARGRVRWEGVSGQSAACALLGGLEATHSGRRLTARERPVSDLLRTHGNSIMGMVCSHRLAARVGDTSVWRACTRRPDTRQPASGTTRGGSLPRRPGAVGAASGRERAWVSRLEVAATRAEDCRGSAASGRAGSSASRSTSSCRAGTCRSR